MLLLCICSLHVQICTATRRLSTVLAVLAAIDPELQVFALEGIQLVDSGVKIPGLPGKDDRCVPFKRVSGNKCLGAQTLPSNVQGGCAIIFDAHTAHWLLSPGINRHPEVDSGFLACIALAEMPGMVHRSRGTTDKILQVVKFLQVRMLQCTKCVVVASGSVTHADCRQRHISWPVCLLVVLWWQICCCFPSLCGYVDHIMACTGSLYPAHLHVYTACSCVAGMPEHTCADADR